MNSRQYQLFLDYCFECLIIINSMLCVQKQSDYTGSRLFRVQLRQVSGKRVIVFIATFDNISVLLWQSVL